MFRADFKKGFSVNLGATKALYVLVILSVSEESESINVHVFRFFLPLVVRMTQEGDFRTKWQYHLPLNWRRTNYSLKTHCTHYTIVINGWISKFPRAMCLFFSCHWCHFNFSVSGFKKIVTEEFYHYKFRIYLSKHKHIQQLYGIKR